MSKRTTLRIGHRGAAGSRPEHTRPAFEHAIELGVDMIELDVQLTQDNHLVVLHDRELGRTLQGSGPVRDYRLDELRALDAGAWFDAVYAGEPVLSLEEVLDLTLRRAELNVEIKSPEPDWKQTAEVLANLLCKHGRQGSTIVSSFEVGALECVRATNRSIPLGLLWETPEREQMWQVAGELGVISVHPHWTLIDADVVATGHAKGLAIITWTANATALIQGLVGHGVDGIISDFPERLP